jgi:hypothetical protein
MLRKTWQKSFKGKEVIKTSRIPVVKNVHSQPIGVCNPGQVSIGVTLTSLEMVWLMNALKLKNEKSVHCGKRILNFINIGDGSISIASCDNDKIFGVVLTEQEYIKLIENQKILEFLLKYQACGGGNLDEITKGLYISLLSSRIDKIIKSRSPACHSSVGKHDLCQKYSISRICPIKATLSKLWWPTINLKLIS